MRLRRQTKALVILFFASVLVQGKTSQHRSLFSKLKKEVDTFKTTGIKMDEQIETLDKRMRDVEDTLRYHRLKIPTSDNLTAETSIPANSASSGSKALLEFSSSILCLLHILRGNNFSY